VWERAEVSKPGPGEARVQNIAVASPLSTFTSTKAYTPQPRRSAANIAKSNWAAWSGGQIEKQLRPKYLHPR
jgi:hypothetical protein